MCPRLPWDFRWWTKYECLGLRADLDDAQPAGPLTKVTIAPISGGSFAEEGFSHPYRRGSCRTVVAGLVDFPRCIQLARVAGQNRCRRPGRLPQVHPVSQSRWKVERSHGWL